MKDMTLREALSIATDCLEFRSLMWREAIDDNILCGDELNCFMEADADECLSIAEEQEKALEILSMFVDNSKSLIDDYWNMHGGEAEYFTEAEQITGVEEYQKECPTMKKIKNINDHQFAKLLRDNGAIDNFTHGDGSDGAENTCRWFDKNERLVAIAFYDNSKCIRQVFLPDYIKYEEDSNNETK